MRAYKEKVTDQQVVDKILRTLPPEFDYVAIAIEESKDLDSMEVEELQHSLEVHEMRVNKRKVLKEQAFKTQTNYKGKGKDKKLGETSESFKQRRTDQAQKQGGSSKNNKEWKFDNRKMRCHNYEKLDYYARECWAREVIAEAEPVEFEKTMTEENYEGGDQLYREELDLGISGPPSNKKLIKVNPRGEVVKNKARLVAKGFLQKVGIDYGEVYAPVARIETIRLVVAIAINVGWSMDKLDVKSSFLNGPLEEEVYVNQPLSFVVKDKENKAQRAWNKRIDGYLSQIGFKKCTLEHRVYVKCWKCNMKSEKLLVCLYVYDLLIIDSSEVEIASFKKQMMNEFEMNDLEFLFYFLGIEFEMTRYGMIMHQAKYGNDILKRHNMQQNNLVRTPVEVGLNLKKETDEEQVDITHYRRIVGCLRFMQEPKQSHLLAAKIILRYMQGTIDFGILFLKGEASVELELIGVETNRIEKALQGTFSSMEELRFLGPLQRNL
ncbi:Copia protein, partial [Mucuna pruriens]